MATIYEKGTESEIALFELVKAHLEISEANVKRIKTGKYKGNFRTEISYNDDEQPKQQSE